MVSVKPEIESEVMILLRNAPILIGRNIRMEEAGLALGVFLYWRLGYEGLTRREREDSTLYILNDCSSVLQVLYRRLIADGLKPEVSMDKLDDYINDQIGQVDSTWGAINQTSRIFAETRKELGQT